MVILRRNLSLVSITKKQMWFQELKKLNSVKVLVLSLKNIVGRGIVKCVKKVNKRERSQNVTEAKCKLCDQFILHGKEM